MHNAVGQRRGVIPLVQISAYLELSAQKLADQNLKCALLAIQILRDAVAAYPELLSPLLGTLMPSVFLLLGDKRPDVKEQANDLLGAIRGGFSPSIIVTALCPRICEVHDRVRTAVLQFIGVAVPFCEEYFLVPSNTLGLLQRLSSVIGSDGGKTSIALQSSCKRLLELVFKAAKQVRAFYFHLRVYVIRTGGS
jgi:hypothetical protein